MGARSGPEYVFDFAIKSTTNNASLLRNQDETTHRFLTPQGDISTNNSVPVVSRFRKGNWLSAQNETCYPLQAENREFYLFCFMPSGALFEFRKKCNEFLEMKKRGTPFGCLRLNARCNVRSPRERKICGGILYPFCHRVESNLFEVQSGSSDLWSSPSPWCLSVTLLYACLAG